MLASSVIPDTNRAIVASSLFHLYVFREHYLLIDYDLVKMIYTFIMFGVGFHNSRYLRKRQNSHLFIVQQFCSAKKAQRKYCPMLPVLCSGSQVISHASWKNIFESSTRAGSWLLWSAPQNTAVCELALQAFFHCGWDRGNFPSGTKPFEKKRLKWS